MVLKRNVYPRIARSDLLAGALLILILLLGTALRFTGLNWDGFTHFHPDERFLTQVITAMGGGLSFTLNGGIEGYDDLESQLQRCLERYPDTGGVGGFFDAQCSNYNPHNIGHGQYVYGTLPAFIAHWGMKTYTQLTGDSVWSGYDGAYLVWRAINAAFDAGTILIVFLIGRQIHSSWIGLLGALFYACAPLAIQLAHFGTTDTIATFFAAAAVLFAVRVQQKGRWLDYALFGLMLAAALASRINTAYVVGTVILAALLHAFPAFAAEVPFAQRRRIIAHDFLGLVLAAIISIIAFRFFSPYAFSGPGVLGLLPNPRFFADIATAQFLVSGASESPPNWQWVGRPGFLFPLWNMILWGMGLALGLSAWLGWLWNGWQLVRARAGATRTLVLFAWIGAYFLFTGNLWVMSMRYYLPLYPALAVMAAWALVELVRMARRPGVRTWRRAAAIGVLGVASAFTVIWGLMFTNIYRHEMSVVQASRWIWENVPGDFAMRIEATDAPLINIAIPNNYFGAIDNEPLTQRSQLDQGLGFSTEFTSPGDGIVSTIHAPHLAGADETSATTLRFTIAYPGEDTPLAEATLSSRLPTSENPFGSSYDIPLDAPLLLEKGQRYLFRVEVLEGGPVMTAGTIMAVDGDWEEGVPAKVCDLPPGVTLADDPPPGPANARECQGKDVWYGLLNGYKLQLMWEDQEAKRQLMATALDHSDYIFIGTNRRYDSNTRIPSRWPMTMRYFEALFNGELGFELAGVFQETFELGPLRVSDQYLPVYNAPRWLNEFEAEEAFHVYDHPAVLIFRKSPEYSSAKMRDILYSVPLNQIEQVASIYNCPTMPEMIACDPAMVGVVPWYSLPADRAPTQLQMTPDMRAVQYENGTWAARFDTESIINTQPIITLLAWWLLLVLFGVVAWPLLFVLMPGLADRGYGFAKLVGMALTGWLAWLFASMRQPLWSQSGLLLMFGVVAVFSFALGWRARGEIRAYLREHWQRIAWIEVITLLAFVFFLFVRLTNPDLWHWGKGGEKPMDFAYFNAILRSTIFPAIDPWFANGYLNYYYFGYVIVGTPTLLLGVVPSVAYNLIIPTLFAVTSIGAFSVAFNTVHLWNERRHTKPDATPAGHLLNKVANPWVAGVAALMLACVLGNLDTIRVFGTGVANLGGYRTSLGLQEYLTNQYLEENGVMPEGVALQEIIERANANLITDRLRYEIDHSLSLVGAWLRGFGQMIGGAPLPIGTERWYWGPSRVLAETPGVEGNAITEMPYFTFLYGDLHAHMIDMPVMFFIMAFLLNEFALVGQDQRRALLRFLALAIGALFVAVTRMTNTWDWVTFLLLSVLGLLYMWWLCWRRISRWSLASLGGRVGGFLALHFAFMFPFLAWFATTSESLTLWEGGKTPLWAYFDIHGLFLALIVSLLIWDTARWFRSVRVRSLRGTWPLLLAGLGALAIVLLGSLIAAMRSYQVALIVIPLAVWIGALFFRAGQSRPMQYLLVLAGLGLSLTMGVEIVVLGADIGRQNTVFKFYIQTWLLFSVVAGVAFAVMIYHSVLWSARLRGIWLGVTGLLIAIAALYPVMATRGRAADRMGSETPLTLDGMEYMKYSRQGENNVWIPLVEDYNLIRWMQENIEGSPVIIEAQSAHEYLWSSRIAIYTGLPSVVGWNHHQTQQRTFDPLPRLVRQRGSNVNAFYVSPDAETALAMIKWYGIRYIVVGGLERAYYPPQGLAKFDRMVLDGQLEIVYQEGETTLYKVNENLHEGLTVARLEEN